MKKLISLLTVLMLSLQMTTVFADGTDMTFSSATGAPGETVDINVVLGNEVSAASIGFEIDYDSDALELVNAVAAGATLSQSFSVKPYQAMWVTMQNTTYSGNIATLSFKIKESAAAGDYTISATHAMASEGYTSDESNCTASWDEVVINYVNGTITVEEPAPAGPTMNATKSGSTVSIVATPDGESFSGKFIVAGYDANGLVAVEVLDAAATATATIDADTVKVMWWDSLTGLNSIVPADTDMAK